jgi:hypothetical protein
MDQTQLEALVATRWCSSLHGTAVRLSTGRHNGKPAAFLRALCQDSEPAPDPEDFVENPKYFVNLNPLERETFRRILRGQSIASIAAEDGVERSAVYARICGNSRGQGGMIAKNFWALLWWRCRQRMQSHNSHA